ncbi:MAG: glutamate racemase [Oligoflexia bacterium]|nr:glutamate racemase [Oligoflexia bacterium]
MFHYHLCTYFIYQFVGRIIVDNNCKIGIFDSGFGGLTIFKCIKELLPEYDYIYLGDNARTPYGVRSFETVYQFTTEGVDFLFKKGCRLIIIACNTASARALRSIQQKWLPKHLHYSLFPFLRVLGVIRPTVEDISKFTKNFNVALWATPGTVKSESFALEINHFAPNINLIQTPCPLLVPLVESGELEGAGVDYFISKYWQQTINQDIINTTNVDTLLLACTHYPLLLPSIQKLLPLNIKILTQGELVSESLNDYLKRHPEMSCKLSKNSSVLFYTTDQCDYFNNLARIFMGEKISSQIAKIN